MAEILVRNSLNLNKMVKLNVSLIHVSPKNNNGEAVYVLEVGTVHSDTTGPVPHVKFTHQLNSLKTLDEVIETSVASICEAINWGELAEDKYAPYVDTYYPSGDGTSIWSNVEIVIKDKLPTSGIDLSNMKVFIDNGTQEFDITDEINITGDPFRYTLKWSPKNRVLNTYNGD